MKILQVVGSLDRGGAETFVMNVLRNINRETYQFVFLCYGNKPFDYEREAKELGAKIVRIPDVKFIGAVKYIAEIKKVIKENSIDAVHIHTYYNSMFALIAAALSGVKLRITHSHSTQSETNPSFLKKLYFTASSLVIRTLTTNNLACGNEAGKSLFGKNSKFIVINNGINLRDFAYKNDTRKLLRKQLALPSKNTVLLHVGRFETVKNHSFLIDIFAEYLKKDPSSILLLVGRGPLESKIKQKVKLLKLNKSVKFLGVRSDVKDLYNVADLFIFPSLFEGLPVVLVEAQANGLSIVASDTIDQAAKLTDSIEFYSLENSADEWAQYLFDARRAHVDVYSELAGGQYDINSVVVHIQEIYSGNRVTR